MPTLSKTSFTGFARELVLRGTLKADKIIVVFEHETQEPEILGMINRDYWFWRYSRGYVQIWLFSGLVYDVLKRDECRYMYE